MATVDKSFRVKNGLVVEGSTATVNGSNILTEASTEFLQDTVGAMVDGSTQTNITVTYNDSTGKLNFVAENGVADSTTSDLAEGSNLYFTDERAQDAVGNSLGTGLSYNDSTGAISVTPNTYDAYGAAATAELNAKAYADALTTSDVAEGSNLYFTNERAQDAVATALSNGTHTNISVSYDDNANSISLTGSVTYTDENARDAVASLITNSTHSGVSVVYTDSASAEGTLVFTNTGVTQLSGTANQISVDNSTGHATISLPNAVTFPGTVTLNADPSQALHAVTKQYVDGIAAGLTWKQAANLLASSNVALTGSTNTLTIDGHATLTSTHNGYRILLKGQSTSSENGIYVYSDNGSTYTLARSTDADAYGELEGATVFIEEGTTYGKTSWVQSNHYLTSFSGQVWTQVSGSGTYTAGNGLSLTGTSFSIDTGVTVDVNSSQTLTNKTINLTSNSLTGTVAQFNSALSDGDFATLAGSETLTNKVITSPVVSGLSLSDSSIVFEGSTNDSYETTLSVVDPTADRTISLPNVSGTVVTTGNLSDITSVGTLSQIVLTDAKIDSTTITATTSGVASTIDSFDAATYTAAKYLIQMKNSSGDREVTEVLIVIDGSNNVYVTEYANIITNADLGSISAVYSGGNVNVQITPTANNIAVKATRTLLEA